MAKKFRRLQHISTIPILAALLLSQNPSAVVNRQRTPDTPQNEVAREASIEINDSRLSEN